MNTVADILGKPDGGRISYAKVPMRVHLVLGIVNYFRYLSLIRNLGDRTGIYSPLYPCIEGTFKFLFVLLWGHEGF